MRHLSRHITLHCDYFGYFRSFNLIAICFVFGHLKMSSSQVLARCTANMCNILYTNVYQCVDNLMFF